jgi:hypothetical protein
MQYKKGMVVFMRKRFFIGTVLGVLLGFWGKMVLDSKILKINDKKTDKFKKYYILLDQWLSMKQTKTDITGYFKENGYEKIAIYGMGELGNRLYDELKDTDIYVAYGIDKNNKTSYPGLKIYSLEDDFENADVIVVTAIFAYSIIKKELAEKTNIPVISLEDVIYGIDI